MGARPSSFKKGGGGFLNGVDATIAGYRLTDEFLGHAFKPGKFKDAKTGKSVDKKHAIYGEVAFRVDGADEDTLVPLKLVNDYDAWTISDDEKTLEPTEEGQGLSGNAGFSKFISSLCNPEQGDGFPEDRFPEEDFNWEAMIGTRVRLIQKVDADRTKEFGQRVNKKTGKGFDRTDLTVDQVYELPTVGGKKGAKGAKPAPTSKGKPAPVEEDDNDGGDVAEAAADALKRYLADAKDNSLAKSKLRMKVLTDATFKNDTDTRDAVVKFLADDDNLGGIDGVSYDAESKNQVVSLDE